MTRVTARSITEPAPELKAKAAPFVDWLKAHTSYDRPASGSTIAEEFEISELSIRLLVHWLRSKGDPLFSKIGSDNRGYYWAESWSDAQHTLAQMRSRADSIYSAVHGMCRAFKRDEHQPELEL